jgi:head decoration protein D
MPVLNEGRYAGEFVVSDGNGRISRETITILSGQNLTAAAVLGKITASGKYKALDPAASDGTLRPPLGFSTTRSMPRPPMPGASPSCASPRSMLPSWSGPPASPRLRRPPHSANSHP